MATDIVELLKLPIDYAIEQVKYKKEREAQWEKLFAGQDYNGLSLLAKFVEHNDWVTITEKLFDYTTFGNGEYLPLVEIRTNKGKLKLFEIKINGKRKSVRINSLIYPEFQKNAIKYKFIERVK